MAAKLAITILGRTEERRPTDGKRCIRMAALLSVEVDQDTRVTRLAVSVVGESACGWLESGSVKYHSEPFITAEKVLFESTDGKPKCLRRGLKSFPFFFNIMRDKFFPSTCNMTGRSKDGLVRYATIKYKLCAEMIGNKKHHINTTETTFKVKNPLPLVSPTNMPPIPFDGEFHPVFTRRVPGDIIVVGTLNRNLLDIGSEEGIKVSLRVDNLTSSDQVINIYLREDINLLVRGRARHACNEYRAVTGCHSVMAKTRKNIISDSIHTVGSKVIGTVESLKNVFISYNVVVHIPHTTCKISVPVKIGSLVGSPGRAEVHLNEVT